MDFIAFGAQAGMVPFTIVDFGFETE